MKPIALRLYGFGSFATEQTFTFATEPGLYFLQGRNEAEPRLGANGAGKTTLLRALTWVLFGKDPRGMKAGDVANWTNPKGASVAFDFEVDRDNTWMAYTVERTHAPNSWTLANVMDGDRTAVDLTKDDTNELMSMLRLDYTTWLNCVLMAQGEPMFLDMRAEPQAALFAGVLGLDKWVDRSKRAGTLADDADRQMRTLERDTAELRGRIESIDAAAVGVSDDAARWKTRHTERVTELTGRYESAMKARSALEADATNREMYDDPGLQSALASHGLALAALVKARDRHTTDSTRLAVDEAEADRLKTLSMQMEGAEICPTCHTLLDGKGLHHQPPIHDDHVRAQLKVRDSYGYAMAAKRKVEEAIELAKNTQERVNTARSAADEGDRARRAATIAYEAAERELDRLEDAADELQREVNPYEGIQHRAVVERGRLSDELTACERGCAEVAERESRLRFWVSGFKHIRLAEIANGVDELALEVNGAVMSLGLADWDIAFAVDKETKSGGISRGFTVLVRSPHNDRSVPWDSWSGGEAQRLRVAGQMGLADLIRSRTGADFGVEFWDEPTNGLSAQGITDLLDSMRERAHRERRVIYIIDHRALVYGGFDGGATVVKDNNGSRIES